MRIFTVDPLPGTQARLEVYLREKAYEFVDHSRRPAVLICPGGGYSMTADRESEPVARRFIQKGYQAISLRYSVRTSSGQPPLEDAPLREAAAAVAYVRAHAEDWGIDPQKITVCGFSAGGHLAALLGTQYMREDRIGVPAEEARPNAMLLCYGVLSAGESTHGDSIRNLTGRSERGPLDASYDPAGLVSEQTPPAFLWHTVEDDCVPVRNALLMADALERYHVPFALHLFTHGWHGLSLGIREVGGGPEEPKAWFSLALDWLEGMGVGTK